MDDASSGRIESLDLKEAEAFQTIHDSPMLHFAKELVCPDLSILFSMIETIVTYNMDDFSISAGITVCFHIFHVQRHLEGCGADTNDFSPEGRVHDDIQKLSQRPLLS